MTGPVFAATAPDLLIVRPLDGLTAIFHRPSGQTHIVTSPMPEIIAALQDAGPLTSPALLAALGLDEGADLLNARLAELETTGLVARA